MNKWEELKKFLQGRKEKFKDLSLYVQALDNTLEEMADIENQNKPILTKDNSGIVGKVIEDKALSVDWPEIIDTRHQS